MAVLETLVRHASGAIDLVLATGLVEQTSTQISGETATLVTVPGPRPTIPDRPNLQLDTAPRTLKATAKAGQIVLLKDAPAAQVATISGPPTDTALRPPAEAAFAVTGAVFPTNPAYHPRQFAVTAGGGQRLPLDMHLRPASVRGAALGALLEFDDGAPASWAIVTLAIALGAGDPDAEMVFRAQADLRGEVRVPLTGLPLPSAAAVLAGNAMMTATVTVRGARAASGASITNPDTFTNLALRGPDALAFGATAQFQIDPARPAQLASFDGAATGDRLVLQQP